ncbi:protein IQ-DOMAIN 10-like [Rutidosis leptorrhynchoides]|uniref:protein IQ-DOMAIN 10-like n=1 Tax=Rutidosis leptorrhynchoides TaxID=125765 RepID=UPI003A98F1B6
MGSGDWMKNIISKNKASKQKSNKMKECSLLETNVFSFKSCFTEEQTNNINKKVNVGSLTEDVAALRIQSAFRGFKARKFLCNLKRVERLQTLMEGKFGKNQTSNTLKNLQSWSKIQAHIRTRRLAMAEENGINQKKLENQLKLDAKVEWSGNSHTMVEALARIKRREEAAVKRERAMAYAFSHQWRAHSNSKLGPGDSNIATSNWAWSWTERWIAARPWENRALVGSTPKKVNSPTNKKSPSPKKSKSLKNSPSGKKTLSNRRLSYGSAEKVEDLKTKVEKVATN